METKAKVSSKSNPSGGIKASEDQKSAGEKGAGLCGCCIKSKKKPGKKSSTGSRSSFGDLDLKSKKGKKKKQGSMSGLIHTVQDKEDFDVQLKEAGTKLVVVDFYATWCGPCKMISPKLEEMASTFTDVIFLKVDVDDCEEVASTYGISCMPTFILFRNAAKVADFSGANADKLRELIVSHK